MASTITCPMCQDVHSADWAKVLSDRGTYTFCPSCQLLDWEFPPELSPYHREGFPVEFTVDAGFSQDKNEGLVALICSRLDEIGCKFEFDLDDSASGVISGMVQKELTSWPFDPDQEDSEGNAREISRLSPEYLEQIVSEAIEEMLDNFGSDGWEGVRNRITNSLDALVYEGKLVEVTVGPGEWTGRG